jgi:pimeloyl-ACP methyl ester carboxylesterase
MTAASRGIASHSIRLCTIVLLTAAMGAAARAASVQADAPKPRDGFVTANGIRLHYVDWGGTGEALLFLDGLGDTIDRFDSFAPKFTDRFRVLGLERRGQGQSDKPASGYGTRTLAADIRAFLDAMRINRVTLIGHSIAGAEMTAFAGRYPERLAKLVYLDAAYDNARAHELAKAANFPFHKDPDASIAAIDEGANQTHPDYAKVAAPALAFFVLYDKPYETPQMSEEARRVNALAFRVLEGAYKREQIDEFHAKVKRGRVVELRDTNHLFFQDPKRSDDVVRQIRGFLLDE